MRLEKKKITKQIWNTIILISNGAYFEDEAPFVVSRRSLSFRLYVNLFVYMYLIYN